MKDNYADVCVLMSTYNGERYLREQIDSILAQEGVNVKLLVRDDGSKDGTLDILEEYKTKDLLDYYSGDNLGAAFSFLQLLKDAPDCPYYAFSDQDDVWLKDKLVVGINQLKKRDDIPAFYNSMTTVVDANLAPAGKEYGSTKIYNFATQIARSNVIGCTMILNKFLREVLSSKNPDYVIMHDQWIACVCKGIGGIEIKDSSSYILYRQHGDNEVGARQSAKEKIQQSALKSGQHSRLQLAEQIQKILLDDLTPENRKTVSLLAECNKNLKQRIKSLGLRLNTESFVTNAWIKVSILFGLF